MANDLYEADILVWSEQQAALLRRISAHVSDQIGRRGDRHRRHGIKIGQNWAALKA